MSDPRCNDCGACCAGQHRPPFVFAETYDTRDDLPNDVLADLAACEEGLRTAVDFRDDLPCFWLTSQKRCKYYEHRPVVCRDFEPGSEGCQAWRGAFNIDCEPEAAQSATKNLLAGAPVTVWFQGEIRSKEA